MSATTAFVAGATGYTGRAVVAALAGRRIPVVAHVRPDSSRLAEWRERFAGMGAVVSEAPWEVEAMAASLRAHRPALVFALLGTTRARARAAARAGRPEAGYAAIDVGLTLLLLEAAGHAVPEARFVYLSSIGVRQGTGNPYLAARAEVERRLAEGAQPYTIARPSFITGPDRDETRLGERIGAGVSDAALAVLGVLGARRWRARYRSTRNVELAEALVRVALDPACRGRVVESEHLR